MNSLLLITLIGIDLVLVGLVFVALKRRQSPDVVGALREMEQEQRILKELRDSTKDELEQKHHDMKLIYERVMTLVTEAEMELKSSSEGVTKEVAAVLEEARKLLDDPLEMIAEHRTRLSSLLQKSQKERQILHKAVARAEKISRFFDARIPYEEVLDEIEDKKYQDARFLLSKGLSPHEVAAELSLPESEVQMIAAMG